MKQGNQKKPPFWVRSKSGTQNAWIAFVILGAIGVFFFIISMASRLSRSASYDDLPIWIPILICIMPGILIGCIIFISTGLSKAQQIRENTNL